MLRDRLCKCDNCGHMCNESQLRAVALIQDLCCRIDAGAEVPAGECPECGALSYYMRDPLHVPEGSVAELTIALALALELNRHYAKLLNQYDGGERVGFDNTKAWVKRLRETGQLKDAP